MSINDFVKKINYIKYSESDYKSIIDSITILLKKYYYFKEIEKKPPINILKVDLIKELNEINIKNITYLDFNNNIQSIIYKTKDDHFNVIFQNFDNYYYCIPVTFYVKQKIIKIIYI